MKKLFLKNEILFAVLWIILYVVGFANADMLSEKIGMEKSVTCVFGLILSAVLFAFVRKNRLCDDLGLCSFQGNYKKHLYFLPLIAISCVNLIGGFQMNMGVLASVLYILSMLFVAFLEEIIFRGLLFKAMSKDNLKIAVIVSSLTFGMGHIVNLFLGEPVLQTLLQLMYASAVGFLFTALFLTGKSLLPCILSHAFINATSVFARPMTNTQDVLLAVMQTVLGIGYGVWLLKAAWKETKSEAD